MAPARPKGTVMGAFVTPAELEAAMKAELSRTEARAAKKADADAAGAKKDEPGPAPGPSEEEAPGTEKEPPLEVPVLGPSPSKDPARVAPKEMGSAPAGATPTKKKQHLPVGAMIDKKYAVLRVLGEGGMGVVYLARDVHTGLDVVIKAIRSELAHREDVRARTLTEGRLLAQIDHPNVVGLRMVVVEGPSLYLVMQYIEGQNLDKLIAERNERGEKLGVEEALGIFRQIAAGVGAAHQEGVIHRDLKPANVLLRAKDGVAKVTDFGIAKTQGAPVDPNRPTTKGVLGSLWYMSPEQVTGRRDLDQRVDVYALGILLFQMLTGHVPFDAPSEYEIMRLQAEEPLPLASKERPELPKAVDDLLQKACAKDRAQRYQSCAELLLTVDQLLGRPHLPTLAIPFEPRPASMPSSALAPPVPSGPTLVTSSHPGDPPGGAKPRKKRVVWPFAVLAAVILGSGGAAGAFALGYLEIPGYRSPWVKKKPPAKGSASGEPAKSAKAPGPDAGAHAGIDALAGLWSSNGHDFEAVVVGSELEFRVKHPEQLGGQNYEANEARFVLKPTSDPVIFAVEDRLRPLPPVGRTFEAKARASCLEILSQAGGEPLRARYDGSRLSVDLAKVEPTASNFVLEGMKVTGCSGLRALKSAKTVSVLTRL